MKRAPVLLFLAWLSTLFYSGIWLFMSGFLLMRIELNNQSTCSEPPYPELFTSLHPEASSCWSPHRFNKAVIVIIDALKYDFAKYDPANTDPKPYENKLDVIHQLTQSQPRHARLYPFRADPPTTTMQRIKGVTTGSLPTFVDVGSNFASYAIQEDNLIHQMVQNGKRVVFMGDDTWDGLFPKKFYKSYFFPSFNVKDLHTVDDGILQHLYPTVDGEDWDVVIAHFLGVDHCGHKHGPDHPETAKKLTQMNQMLRSLIEHLDENTMLVVAGDHGMTDTGDHGGDSEKEVTAALFLYSKTPLFSEELFEEPEAIPQVDLVPSLALLLGVPIPFSNLGSVISDLFWWSEDADDISALLTKTKAYQINAQQVARYLSSYSQAAGDLPADKLKLLEDLSSSAMAQYTQLMSDWEQKLLSKAEMEERLTKLMQKVQHYLSQARHVCMESWARFHPLRMIFGSLVLLMSCFLCYVVAEAGLTMKVSYKHLLGYPVLISVLLMVVLCMGTWMTYVDMDLVSICALVIVISQLSFLYIFRSKRYAQKRWWSRPSSLLFSGPCVILSFRCCALFSDSFVVAEGKVAPFFLTSLLLLSVAKLNWDGKLTLPTFTSIGSESLKPSLTPTYRKDAPRLLLLLAALGLCIRLSGYFHNCREETPECQPSAFLTPLSSVRDSELKNFSYVCCVLCLGVIIYLVRRWLQHYGNLNSSSPLVLYVRWGFPLIALGISCFWALSSGTGDSFAKLRELTHLALVAFPRAIYIFAGMGILLTLWKPMTVYMKRSQDSGADNTVTTYGVPGSQAELRHVIPQIYRKMQHTLKSRLQHGGERDEGKKGAALEAYGLGSVYSAAMVITLSLLTLVLIMLHSERMTPVFLLLLLEALVILQIHGHVSNLYWAPDDNDTYISKKVSTTKVFHQMRAQHGGERDEGKKGAALEAYGLGSVYSAAMVITLSLLTLVLIMLHSECMTPVFLLLLLEEVVILQIHGHVSNLYWAPDDNDLFCVPWYAVIAWALAATQCFYSTGHQPVFPAIHWNSAFVGFQDGHTNNVIPALLVAANTFCSNILFSAGSCLLLLWPFLCESPTSRRKKAKRETREGEMEDEDMPLMEMRLRENPDCFSAALLQLGAKYLFIQGVQLLSCVCAAMILRRHLMVWKVFAPKFLFEALGFTISSLSVLCGIGLVLRVDCVVSDWFRSLLVQQSR